MKPRYAADYRSLVWAAAMPLFALAPLALGLAGHLSTGLHLAFFLWPVSCYLAVCGGVMAHNHNHCPTFKSRRVNAFFANWVSVFYGYPVFAWIPTHNLNHHKFINKKGDATITWRHTNKNTPFVAFSYFFVSAYHQSGPIQEYIRKAKAGNPKVYRQVVTQYATFIAAHLAMFAAIVATFGWKSGLAVWVLMLGFPAFVGLWTLMFFNYVQHVHTDPWSEHSHSRNFVGSWLNFLLFNNGLHGAHHENPGAHWSTLPKLHAEIADQVDPSLNVPNTATWLFKQYVLAPFFPRFGTQQVGRAPFSDGEGPRGLVTGAVDAVEAGVNASMV